MLKPKLWDWITLSVLILVSALCLLAINTTGDKTDQIDNYKSQLKEKDAKIVEQQLLYEKMRGDLQHAYADLADRDERLSQAAKRERAAKRANRSRRTFSASRSTSLGQPASTFTGGLREITMYCPTGNRTASGKWPTQGMVATLSRSIPFGTQILIQGLGRFVVEDRIGHGSDFDIYTDSCAEANKFGRTRRQVTILGR